MWTRALLKSNARQVLSRTYWHFLLGGLIYGVLTGAVSLQANVNLQNVQNFSGRVFLGAGTLSLVWTIFVANVLEIGYRRFAMENRSGTSPYGTIFSVFSNNYLNAVLTQFLVNLSIFLWSLLLIIPGIIKALEYTFVPYLLAENPDMSTDRAKELSRLMTDGEKGEIFILGLSFLGWQLLGAITIIGSVFVRPYIDATYAELYAAARAKAFALGYTDENELSGFIAYN